MGHYASILPPTAGPCFKIQLSLKPLQIFKPDAKDLSVLILSNQTEWQLLKVL